LSRIYRVHPAELDRRRVLKRVRHLTADEQLQLQDMYKRGWKRDALCVRFGISRRSLYRYLEGDIVDVEVGGFVASFWLRPGQLPAQIECWSRAADEAVA
jgi:hypothetical protein